MLPGSSEPTVLQSHAAWVLVAAYVLSATYELWRATAKAGTTEHDSMRNLLTQDLVLYVIAAGAIATLFLGLPGSAWIGLAFSVIFVLVSILYYNPRIMMGRAPGLVDWFEDLVYTGLLFVAAALLLYDVSGMSIQA